MKFQHLLNFSIFKMIFTENFPGKEQNISKSVRFSNFLRFRNGNRRFFQKISFQKLEKIRKSKKKIRVRTNPF